MAEELIALPPANLKGNFSLEEAIASRRSVRRFAASPLALSELGQLLWAAQGITDAARGFRAAPSAGATFPLEVIAAVGPVDGLDAGLYRYFPREHMLARVAHEDVRQDLRRDALSQPVLGQAAVVLLIAAVLDRTARRYGPRASRYVHIEVGHAAQNVCLQAEALGLASVCVGAFDDDRVGHAARLAPHEAPLYMIAVGRPADRRGPIGGAV